MPTIFRDLRALPLVRSAPFLLFGNAQSEFISSQSVYQFWVLNFVLHLLEHGDGGKDVNDKAAANGSEHGRNLAGLRIEYRQQKRQNEDASIQDKSNLLVARLRTTSHKQEDLRTLTGEKQTVSRKNLTKDADPHEKRQAILRPKHVDADLLNFSVLVGEQAHI